jgi:hypothetical protein
MLPVAEEEPTVASLSFTDQERAVIELVSRACQGMILEISKVDVHTLEGGTVSTLRFTLEERASTDLELARIAGGEESADALASGVVAELRKQMGS